jgi:SteA-like C-terminal domain
VSELVSRRVGVWPLVAFAGAGVAAITVAIVASPDLRVFIQVIGQRLLDIVGLG